MTTTIHYLSRSGSIVKTLKTEGCPARAIREAIAPYGPFERYRVTYPDGSVETSYPGDYGLVGPTVHAEAAEAAQDQRRLRGTRSRREADRLAQAQRAMGQGPGADQRLSDPSDLLGIKTPSVAKVLRLLERTDIRTAHHLDVALQGVEGVPAIPYIHSGGRLADTVARNVRPGGPRGEAFQLSVVSRKRGH